VDEIKIDAADALTFVAGGTTVVAVAYATWDALWNVGSKNTIISSMKSGDSNVWLNGTQIVTSDATAWDSGQISQLTIGARYDHTLFADGTYHRAEIYDHGCIAEDELVLRNQTLLSDISAENSLVTLPLEMDYDNGSSVQITPVLGQLLNLPIKEMATLSTLQTRSRYLIVPIFSLVMVQQIVHFQ
jgi:hypothetical protein